MLAWPTGATNAVIGDPITVAVAGAPSARRWKTRVVAGFGVAPKLFGDAISEFFNVHSQTSQCCPIVRRFTSTPT
jgi:hypothetical protein